MRASLIFCMLGFSAAVGALPTNVTFTNYFNGQVTFTRPLFFAEVPGKDSNYVVLEEGGLAGVVHRRNGSWVKDTLLKINTAYSTTNNTLGLLGLAFSPNFTTNKKYYVFYSSTTTANVLEEMQADASLIKDAGIAPRRLLTISSRAATTNNGGNIAFGPNDGYLYIGIGDGGSLNGDAANVAQATNNLQGKFLRIDVNSQPGGNPYAIPSDNPFVGNSAYSPEIWALGVRSPWRWSFDALTKNLWVGEVGNSTWEEVDTVTKGANLGWRLMEGFGCQPGVTCSKTGMTLPMFAYGHSGGDNAIIGGYVYRGDPASPFYGAYFFGDNGSGHVRAIRVVNGVTQDSAVMSATIAGLSSFGADSKGSLYATSVNTNLVYRLTSADLQPVPIWKSERKIGRAMAPISGRAGFSNLKLLDLQGKKASGMKLGNGVYVTRDRDGLPSLVPALK